VKRNYFKKIIKTFGYLDFFSYLCTTKTIKQKEMDKKSNVRVVGFPKETYDKEWLDTLNDRQRSETALADGDSLIWDSLDSFQEDIHLTGAGRNVIDLNWIYFLND
jgi:hypothetical protein